jgi:hypothetical protein
MSKFFKFVLFISLLDFNAVFCDPILSFLNSIRQPTVRVADIISKQPSITNENVLRRFHFGFNKDISQEKMQLYRFYSSLALFCVIDGNGRFRQVCNEYRLINLNLNSEIVSVVNDILLLFENCSGGICCFEDEIIVPSDLKVRILKTILSNIKDEDSRNVFGVFGKFIQYLLDTFSSKYFSPSTSLVRSRLVGF